MQPCLNCPCTRNAFSDQVWESILHFRGGFRRRLAHPWADPNKEADEGFTPLALAASKGHKDVVQVLPDRGAELNQGDANGWTPLHVASLYGQTDVVQLLLRRGADLNNMTVNGDTPLSFALHEGHTDIVNILQVGDV